MIRRTYRRLVRLFFQLLYNQLAWTYDVVAWLVSLGRWRAWGRKALPHLRGERILELAHGPGHLLASMAQRGISPVGLDRSPYMGRLARRRLHEIESASGPSEQKEIPLLRGRAQALPFRDRCFDSIAVTFPTEFILDPATGREAARVLAPGGRFVVIVEARLTHQDILSRFIERLYAITGQRQGFSRRVEATMAQTGFTPHVLRERLGHSEITIVIGDQPTQDDNIAKTHAPPTTSQAL